MNVVDALKSGRPLRRPHWPIWYFQLTGKLGLQSTDSVYYLTNDDLLADDWEVKRVPREWTFWVTDKGALSTWDPGDGDMTEDGWQVVRVREVIE